MEDIFKKIRTLSQKNRDYTANLLCELVKAKSLSQQEQEVCEVLKKQMEEAGFDYVEIDPLGNVIGRIGPTNGKRKIAFDGHIDTVDFGNLDNWKFDPLAGKISEDGKYVMGRGSTDQKGGVAAFVSAGKMIKDLMKEDEEFKKKMENLTIYFVGSVMEEDCDGLCWKYIIEEDKLRPDCVVSTEPTECRITRGHRGRMEITVSFRGISAHGSAPERGKNAIYMASRTALEIEKLNEKLAETADPFLGKGSVTISEIVSGSPSLCAVSDFARFHLDRRLTWGETKESAVKEIENIIYNTLGFTKEEAQVKVLYYEGKAWTGLNYGMEKYYPTWKLEEDHEVIQTGVKAFKSVLPDKKCIVDKWVFSTNGVTINGYHKIPVLGFGPGEEKMAHAPNEVNSIDELEICSAFYTSFAFCNAIQ